MGFTYSYYENMLNLLKEQSYEFSNYYDYNKYTKCVILRHDVDVSLEYALVLAKLEHENNIKSTYFILLSSDFYNIFSKKSKLIIEKIKSMGHCIGLHFDELKYDINSEVSLKYYVNKEINIISNELGLDINIVSMHRPSKWVLESDIKFENIINSYSKEFFENFKYVSDSRMKWHEDIESIIKSNMYNRLHILTHALWYKEKEIDAKNIFISFINDNKKSLYNSLNENISNFSEILKEGEISK